MADVGGISPKEDISGGFCQGRLSWIRRNDLSSVLSPAHESCLSSCDTARKCTQQRVDACMYDVRDLMMMIIML